MSLELPLAGMCALPDEIPAFCCCSPLGHLQDLCGALGWGLQPFLHQPGREWQGIAASSCLLLNIYDPGSLAAPHPPRVDFVLPSGIAGGLLISTAAFPAGLGLHEGISSVQGHLGGRMVVTEGSSLSRRFLPPCPGDLHIPQDIPSSLSSLPAALELCVLPSYGISAGGGSWGGSGWWGGENKLRGGVGGQQPWENGWDKPWAHLLLSLPRHSWADALSSIRLPYVKYICPHA